MRTAALTLLAVAGCTPPGSKSALDVTVRLAAGTTSKCVKVIVQTDTGVEKSTGPMKVTAGEPLKVAVFRDSLPATVSVQAQGYGDDTCTARTVPAEESTLAAATFQGGVTPLELVVVATAAVDGDGDGYSPPGDCNDADPTIKPNATEACADGIDNDCDGSKDCADPDCHLQACGGGATCSELTCKETNCADGMDGDGDGNADCMDTDCDTKACGSGTGAVCMGTTCQETVCNDQADNDLDMLKDCQETACAGQPCSARGVCDAGSCYSDVEDLCGDNVDNDADTLTDCADPDCNTKACSDGNLCTTGETCSSGMCRNAMPVVCNMPTNQCSAATGTCNPSTGNCDYAVRVDGGCIDADPCTVTDRCSSTGTCSGVPQTCAAKPGPCFENGVCQASLDGGCSYAVRVGACDDGDACTVGDACGVDGGCVPGTATMCTPPECKTFTAGNCDGTGACIFTNSPPNAPCGTGGFCDGMGTCRTTPTFPFTPDTIVPALHPPPASAATVVDCALTFISGPDAGFVSLCAGMQPPAISIADGGAAGPLSVISANHLYIADAGSLTLTGAYPVVLLVWGDAGINGPVLANTVTDAGRLGPGATNTSLCLSRTGDAGVDDGSHGGGGGGAGFGTPGASGGSGGGSSRGGAGGSAADGGDLPLWVGCPGGAGIDSASVPVPGGRGGGAVQLVVAGGLTVNAVMSVSGGGGAGGVNSGGGATDPGGGGGGSGGTLLLQAARLTLTGAARLTSNGGAGGGGADNGIGGQGADGFTNSSTIATAGVNQGGGGAGGTGGAGTTPPAAGASTSKGGGGGGGAVGRIFLKQPTTAGCSINGSAVISPPAVKTNCP